MAKAFSRASKKGSRFFFRKKRKPYVTADPYFWARRIFWSMRGHPGLRSKWADDMEKYLEAKKARESKK